MYQNRNHNQAFAADRKKARPLKSSVGTLFEYNMPIIIFDLRSATGYILNL